MPFGRKAGRCGQYEKQRPRFWYLVISRGFTIVELSENLCGFKHFFYIFVSTILRSYKASVTGNTPFVGKTRDIQKSKLTIHHREHYRSQLIAALREGRTGSSPSLKRARCWHVPGFRESRGAKSDRREKKNLGRSTKEASKKLLGLSSHFKHR